MKEADFAHLVMIFNQILRFLIPALLLPCLDRVEALSIDSGCRADREEGVRIYKLDMAQDHIEVSLSGGPSALQAADQEFNSCKPSGIRNLEDSRTCRLAEAYARKDEPELQDRV